MITKNAMQLKALIKNKAKEINVAPQLVLQNYMLERLLERISKSEYSDKFIIFNIDVDFIKENSEIFDKIIIISSIIMMNGLVLTLLKNFY